MTAEAEGMQIVTVRGRPVGIERSRFGASLIAVERGYFPVSPTGYWSLSGYGANQPGPLTISSQFLESLAEAKDRERRALLINLNRATRPEGNSRWHFIHVSLLVDKAIDEGFFAPPEERAPLWQACHRLLNLVAADRRFQPVPDSHAWTEAQCAKAVKRAQILHEMLKRFASGDYSGEIPLPFFGAKAYARLPATAAVEPVVRLHETAIELSFDLKVSAREKVRSPQRTEVVERPAPKAPSVSLQMGLFPETETKPTTAPRLSA